MAQLNDQCRKPHGKEGIETIKNMNKNHERISEFAFKCIKINKDDKIIDIGCGGGVNIDKFLKKTNNNVYGLDYSEVSVSESTKRNKEAVNEGRCEIIQANVMDMPLEDEQFNIVSAFETIYFWPDLNVAFKEIYRILKNNGQFMIGLGTDGHHPDDKKWLNEVEGMNLYTKEDLSEYLENAGFKSISLFQPENEHILVTVAKK